MLVTLINWCFGYVRSFVRKEELFSSKYMVLYSHRRKKIDIEDLTINMLNDYLSGNLPVFIKSNNKKIIIDCTVLFLKFMTIHYESNPGNEIFQRHFDKIIKNNIKYLK
jgi:hypothetical protein